MYNEAGNVRPLIQQIISALDRLAAFEIIVVDDASEDDTAGEVRALAGSTPVLRLIRHACRSGQSTALWNGVRAARYPWIVTLDGDLQNNPDDIPGMLQVLRATPAERRVRLIIGHRQQRKDSGLRHLSSRVANGVRRRLLHDATPDAGCGLKLFERSAFLELPYFDHMHRFLPALMQQLGYGVMSVRVDHRPRIHGRSKYGINNRLWVGLIDLAGVAWLARRNRRVQATEELLAHSRREQPHDRLVC